MKKLMLLILGLCTGVSAVANERLIIKYKETQVQINQIKSGKMTKKQVIQQMMIPLSTSSLSRIKAYANNISVIEVNQVANGAHVIELQKKLIESELKLIINRIKSDPSIEYVEVDRVLKHMSIPSYNPIQWDMIQPVNGDNFQNLQNTWSNMSLSGSPGDGVIVAVIDSGYTPHVNFLNNLVPLTRISCSSLSGSDSNQCYGYTFISDCAVSGAINCMNNEYQPDALDWGDYVLPKHPNSSWHGSHVTGTIVGNGYTGGGTILGGAYGAKALPVRAIGRGGGYTSDIANAILWSVNQYSGINNPNPAQIINLSLGGEAACAVTMQSAINTAIINNAIIVAAAGNAKCANNFCTTGYDVYNVSQIMPANCNNVISVSAKGSDNDLSWYSSYGKTTITASGGDVYPVNNGSMNQVYSDIWNSTQTYQRPNQGGMSIYTSYEGTSQAAPHVVSTIADLISYFNQKGKQYNTASIIEILQKSAGQLTNSSNYNASPRTQGQGGSVSGLTLNANNALLYAQSIVIANVTASPSSWSPTSNSSQLFTFINKSVESVTIESFTIINSDSSILFSINENTCVGTVLAYQQTCNIEVTLNSYGVDSSSLQLKNESGIVSFVPINVNNIAPAVPSSGGGGGCSAIQGGKDYSLLLLLLGLSILYAFYYFKRKCDHK
ncbi:MAG: S8 family serine peptidase [Neisseriaceae bacterium]